MRRMFKLFSANQLCIKSVYESFFIMSVAKSIATNVPTVAEGRGRRTPAASEYSKCNQKINRFQTHLTPACGNCVLSDVLLFN